MRRRILFPGLSARRPDGGDAAVPGRGVAHAWAVAVDVDVDGCFSDGLWHDRAALPGDLRATPPVVIAGPVPRPLERVRVWHVFPFMDVLLRDDVHVVTIGSM